MPLDPTFIDTMEDIRNHRVTWEPQEQDSRLVGLSNSYTGIGWGYNFWAKKEWEGNFGQEDFLVHTILRGMAKGPDFDIEESIVKGLLVFKNSQ